MNDQSNDKEYITEELRCELIDKYWDINVEHEWWDNVYHDFRVSMQEKGITVDDINFNCNVGRSCQHHSHLSFSNRLGAGSSM